MLSVLMSITYYSKLFDKYAVEEVVSVVQSCLTTYSEEISVFYSRFFGMLTESMRSSLGECRREVGELNRRLGYEMVRFDPMAGIRA